MKKKIQITEDQFRRLLPENAHLIMVKRIKTDLDNNYTPIQKAFRKGGEYYNKQMIQINIDKEIISLKSLVEYLQNKYNVSYDFTKQVVTDWLTNSIDDNFNLTQNIPIS